MKKLFLTAGHHLKDSGAIANKKQENILTLEFMNLVTTFLKELNPDIEVWNDDFKLTLSEVISKVKEKGTSKDLWIEFHFNAFNGKASGFEIIIANNASDTSKKVANELSFMADSMGIVNRGIKTESQTLRGKLGMFRTVVPSVLIELAFIDNDSDMAKWKDKRVEVAKELAKYLNNLYTGGWKE